MKLIHSLIALILVLPTYLFSQNFDTQHTALSLEFDWKKKQAFGSAEITGSVLERSDKIYLDAGKLHIQTIKLNGKNLIFNYDGGDADNNLEILLDRQYAPNEFFTLVIAYRTTHENRADPYAISGSFGAGLRFFEPTSTTPQKRKQIWSSGEPTNNKYWFPCNEELWDIHSTDISARIEKPLMLLANGNLEKVVEHGDNTRTFRYTSPVPFPNYLVAIVVGEFDEVVLKSHTTSVRTFGYPQEKAATQATVEWLPVMLDFLETKTDFPYPYADYKQVVVQDYPFPGLVGQHSFALLSDNYVDDFGVHQDFKYLWDGVAMQALANQWFGNLIMPKEWEDLWLNNAFAYYFAGLYTSKCFTEDEYLTYYHPFEKSNLEFDRGSGIIHPIVPKKVTDLSGFCMDSYSKFRGALVLRMLAFEMGEENWWNAIQHYVGTNAGKQVTTKDFQTAVEFVSDESYQWFFDQWIYKIGSPQFEVTKTYLPNEQKLILRVQQIQPQENTTDYEMVNYFQGKIAVEIDGKIEMINLRPQEVNTFTFSSVDAPKWVNFNVHDNFLCETHFEQTTSEYLTQMQNSVDVLAKQNAMNELVITAKDSLCEPALKQQIIAAIQSEFQSTHYWRYRWFALGSLRKIWEFPYSEATKSFLVAAVSNEKSWIKGTAISMLGNTRDSSYTPLYLQALTDESDRVINAAAIALGKTKSGLAFEALMNLENQASWKNQNRISALNGLQELGDERAVPYVLECIQDQHSPRWYLATPTWDYPYAAVNTLVALGKAELAYPILRKRLIKSLKEDDLNDIFQNVQLIDLLTVPQASEIYVRLKKKFKEEPTILEAVNFYESQYLENINN